MRALERAGFVADPSRGAGSHTWMARADPPARTVVPKAKDVKPGTLVTILKQAGLSRDEFLALP